MHGRLGVDVSLPPPGLSSPNAAPAKRIQKQGKQTAPGVGHVGEEARRPTCNKVRPADAAFL
eukprot:4237631-Pyramimonas_sp.AAC.1